MLEKRPTKIIHVTAGDRIIKAVTTYSSDKIYHSTERPTKYTVITVDDIEELSLDDNSLLNTDFDNFLIEYANIRLSIENEYEVSQEQQVMANIYSQIHSKF